MSDARTVLDVALPGDALPKPKPAPPTPAAKPRSTVAEMFAVDTADHRMTVLHDDGLYRHLRFHRPGTGMYHFDLVTWPEHLAIGGDMDAYVFTRITDMFEFFRGTRINPHYWSEKVTTGGRRACKEYSEELFASHAADILSEVEEDWPGVTAAWAEHVGDYDETFEVEARAALDSFSFPAVPKSGERAFQFSDTWEWDLTDYTWHFRWACHAIQWGIARYDEARQAAR